MKKTVITISREYGSGGRIIGKKVAEALGINFYDGELLSLVAKESGYTVDFVRQNDQKKTQSLLYHLYMGSQILPASDMIFIAQSKVIKDLQEKESCVIVGRCADYVLRGRDSVINIFIHAPLLSRTERVKNEYGEKADNYKSYVQKQDKSRIAYYNYFADDAWGKAQTYDLAVNSDIGIDNAVKLIVDYVRAKQGE
ncbi:MAG: cytidylate kinase-like family protein [Ruminiclostridium sp.]|nr:cytidylate kinase-like family protein [Ruminiclostridium sp.]MBQ8841799.1 cytidylate kinase-like family protein [Ruminiclostridium sp.]